MLATKDSVDFLYTCDSHLKDPGFATAVGDSSDNVAGARKLKLSEEEIQKVKEEYEEKQKLRKEKAKQAAEEASKKEGKDADKEKEKERGKEKDKPSTPSQQPSQSSPSPSATPTPSAHQRYTLHREMFAMRLNVHRKRRQTAQAKEIAPRLPSAPRAPVTNN